MAPIKMRLWPFFASIWLVLVANAACPRSLHGQGNPACPAAPTEWMRGVPKGCRLVSFDLRDRDSHRFDQKERVHILWEYVRAANCYDTTLLFDNVLVLNAEMQGDQPFLRVTVALTPCQADRLKVAAACGTLQIAQARGSSLGSAVHLPAWNIHGIEDRTQAIEACLASCPEAPESLERPTLAAEAEGSPGRSHRVITVPVQLEFQR